MTRFRCQFAQISVLVGHLFRSQCVTLAAFSRLSQCVAHALESPRMKKVPSFDPTPACSFMEVANKTFTLLNAKRRHR